MGTTDPTGSAALAERLTAFSGVLGVLIAAGVAPVTAVVLGLVAAVVLSRV